MRHMANEAAHAAGPGHPPATLPGPPVHQARCPAVLGVHPEMSLPSPATRRMMAHRPRPQARVCHAGRLGLKPVRQIHAGRAKGGNMWAPRRSVSSLFSMIRHAGHSRIVIFRSYVCDDHRSHRQDDPGRSCHDAGWTVGRCRSDAGTHHGTGTGQRAPEHPGCRTADLRNSARGNRGGDPPVTGTTECAGITGTAECAGLGTQPVPAPCAAVPCPRWR